MSSLIIRTIGHTIRTLRRCALAYRDHLLKKAVALDGKRYQVAASLQTKLENSRKSEAQTVEDIRSVYYNQRVSLTDDAIAQQVRLNSKADRLDDIAQEADELLAEFGA